MAFTLSTFVRFAGAEALSEHLRSRDVTLAEQIDAEADTAALSKLFRKAWSSLPQAAIEQLNQDFDRAEQFVGEDAQSVLRNSCLRNAAALAVLERWSNDRARALAILRSEPAIFEGAENQLDVLALLRSRQLCASFSIGGDSAPDWSDARLQLFENQAGDVLRRKDGVPRRLHIKHDFRHRLGPTGAPLQPIQQVTVFHEGDVNREAVFLDDGRFTVEERRQALMAAVSYDPELGTLDVAVSGGRKVKQAIADGFASAFLPRASKPLKVPPASFALQRLRRPMAFEFRRSDGLRSTALVSVTLSASGEGRLDHVLRLPRHEQSIPMWSLAGRQHGGSNPLIGKRCGWPVCS